MAVEHSLDIFNLVVSHRGIMGNGRVENSLSAFLEAVKRDLPIELDIHLTSDNKLAVFHDYTLLKMCGKMKIIEKNNYEKIKEFPLKNTSQKIPLLSEVLQLLGGKIPIFIEIKSLFNWKKLCDKLIEELKYYCGEVVVFGFNYKAIRYIKERTHYKVMVSCFRPKFCFGGFVPDAVCCYLKSLKNFPKEKIALPVVSWTVCNEKEELFAKSFGGYLKNFYN